MKELLADMLRKMFGGGAQPTQPAPPIQPLPTLQTAAKQVSAPTRQEYLRYVEECAVEGKPHMPYAQWAAQPR
jgi:hypothetical protein